jgi:hypothetical protein
MDKAVVSAERIVAEYSRLAFRESDLAPILEADAKGLAVKRAALHDLGEHLGIFEAVRERLLALEAVAIHHADGSTGLRIRAVSSPAGHSDDVFSVVTE